MAYVFYNPNPKNRRVGDCSVRAISKALGSDWQDAYIGWASTLLDAWKLIYEDCIY